MTQSAQAYSMKLANQLTKITMEIHNRFYPNQDISFMKYFLELTQQEDEFVVPHKMLIKYGVISSKRSSVILEKLDQLNLEINKVFNLQDILQVRQNRGEVITKVYYLTPEAFKKCLMRARKYPNQDISFMEYFLELTQQEGEFVVPHTKLVEYGIMTSTRSNKIMDKLDQLNLKKNEDFTLHDVVQRGIRGAQTHNKYHLTPEAFKKMSYASSASCESRSRSSSLC